MNVSGLLAVITALRAAVARWSATDWVLLVNVLLSQLLGRWLSTDQSSALAAVLVQFYVVAAPLLLMIVKIVEHRAEAPGGAAATPTPPAPPAA